MTNFYFGHAANIDVLQAALTLVERDESYAFVDSYLVITATVAEVSANQQLHVEPTTEDNVIAQLNGAKLYYAGRYGCKFDQISNLHVLTMVVKGYSQ